MRRSLLALGLGFLLVGPAIAQTAPDAAALKAAREVVSKAQGDRNTVLASMSGPLVGLVQQMGVSQPDRAQTLVQEVILPVMTAHYDELLDVQARSYATVLSASDLQAVSAFYGTPAGQAFAKAQPQLAQAQLAGITQWMGGLGPEVQAKTAAAIKQHGW